MLGEEDVPWGECVGVWLDGYGEGSKGGWLDDWDLGSIDMALIGCQLGKDSYGQEGGKNGGLYSAYVLVCLDGLIAGRPSDRAGYCLGGRNCGYSGDGLGGWLLGCKSGCSLCWLER